MLRSGVVVLRAGHRARVEIGRPSFIGRTDFESRSLEILDSRGRSDLCPQGNCEDHSISLWGCGLDHSHHQKDEPALQAILTS